MTREGRHETVRDGRWKLLVLRESWSAELWEEILERIHAAEPRKHPLTLRLESAATNGAACFLKIYSPPGGGGLIKDFFRDSKGVRALKQSVALSRLGFRVPPVLAAGEERRAGALGSAFLLTREIAAGPLVKILSERLAPPLARPALRTKRRWLQQLAAEVRRLHRHGFVHGDLVVSNIFANVESESAPVFYYMDHDRTRRYPAWVPHRLWKRNLVQLNRFLLPGISVRDRMRFLRFYLEENSPRERRRRLGRWLEQETRRRYGSDRKTPTLSAREI